MRTLLALLSKLLARYNRDHPKGATRLIKPGAFYRIMDRENKLYYSTCHTVGDTIWVEDINEAEILGAGETRQLMEGCIKYDLGYWLPKLVPRSDPKHPLHHSIPAVTRHYTLHQTDRGDWFARAIVDGIRYETIAWALKSSAEMDAQRGSMYDHVKNIEASESKPNSRV